MPDLNKKATVTVASQHVTQNQKNCLLSDATMLGVDLAIVLRHIVLEDIVLRDNRP